MSDTAQSRPALRFVVPLLVVLAALAIVAMAADLAQSDSSLAGGSATLDIQADHYAFAPGTCVVSADGFVVSGSGTFQSERFWVNASASTIQIAVGVESELDTPPDDQLWLTSVGDVEWRRTADQGIEADADLVDSRNPDASAIPGHFEVRCDNDV
ncbi:MAG: hypothetical protein AAF467_24365 [Actinomycetota bacterium]